MKAALREKEILLREIHHRVKNNLQVISSLLSLQADLVTDPRAIEMLKESQHRVRSMALVHEQLHRSPDLSRINFGEYVRSLTASLFSSYGIDSTRISLASRVADVFLPIDVAVPCGLMLQELVSNSIKHAFPGGRCGEIGIEMSRFPDRSSAGSRRGGSGWLLTVRDDGVGLPREASFETASSLGLRLVRILAEQLDGRVECLRRGGTEFRIRFKTDSSAESG